MITDGNITKVIRSCFALSGASSMRLRFLDIFPSPAESDSSPAALLSQDQIKIQVEISKLVLTMRHRRVSQSPLQDRT